MSTVRLASYHCLGFAVSVALVVAACGPPTADAPTVYRLSTDAVAVTGGDIQGGPSEKNTEVFAYKGLPFAAPPIGDLRWRPPAPVVGWNGIRDATKTGAICVQNSGQAVMQDEDCLFLNVWAPVERTEALPVMFWIHGGGYTGGSGSSAIYDGTPLAADAAVVVTINYRLNVFGFMAHPALSGESPHGASGNYGLMDMVAALEWVRDNIATFGGDPNRVTIFGESAGGGAVMSVMLMPQSAGLFHRAIAQSNYVQGWERPLSGDYAGWGSAETQGVRIATALGLEGHEVLADMRAASSAAVLEASNADAGRSFRREGNTWAPNVDGWTIPDDPFEMYASGRQHNVPLITGMTGNEGSLFTRGMGIDTVEAFETHVREAYPELADRLLALYDASSPDTAKAGIDHLIHDMVFAGPVRAHAETHSVMTSPVWLYHFTHVPPTAWGETLGAHHAAELVYVFGTLTRNDDDAERPLGLSSAGDFTDADFGLSETMRAYWLQFAATGDPNRDDLPAWPRFTLTENEHVELGSIVVSGTGLHEEGATLWHAFETGLRTDE